MPSHSTCCFFRSVKTGSYVCGLYTLILYSILFIVGACHATTIQDSATLLGLCLMMVILNASSSISSVVMLYGLYKDKRMLLLPWTVSIGLTTLIDVMVTFYLIKDAVRDPFLAVLFVIDVLITALNVYAVLCVLSQYREYKVGNSMEPTCQIRNQSPDRRPAQQVHVVTSSVTEATSSNALLLQSSSPKRVGSIGAAGTSPTGAGRAVFCELTTIAEEKPIITVVGQKPETGAPSSNPSSPPAEVNSTEYRSTTVRCSNKPADNETQT